MTRWFYKKFGHDLYAGPGAAYLPLDSITPKQGYISKAAAEMDQKDGLLVQITFKEYD